MPIHPRRWHAARFEQRRRQNAERERLAQQLIDDEGDAPEDWS